MIRTFKFNFKHLNIFNNLCYIKNINKSYTRYTSDPNNAVKNKYNHIKDLNNKIENTLENDDNLEDVDFSDINNQHEEYINLNNYNNASKNTVLNSVDYISNKNKYFKKLIKAFQILDDNNVTIEELKENYLKIKILHNRTNKYYIFETDEDNKLITLNSPISGYFKYKYNQKSEFWESIKDNHILDDLIIREFCQHTKGLLIIE